MTAPTPATLDALKAAVRLRHLCRLAREDPAAIPRAEAQWDAMFGPMTGALRREFRRRLACMQVDPPPPWTHPESPR